MTDDERIVSRLEERSTNQADRIDKLEQNQRWGILTILGLLAKAVFDYLGGSHP
jgi:hypothetical protein